MQRKKKRKKAIRIGTIILSVIILLIIAANIYLASNLEKIVFNNLKKTTEEASNGLYHLDMEGLNINILGGYLSANNLSMNIDSTRLAYLHSVDSLPGMYGSAKIKSIKMHSVSIATLLKSRGKKLKVGKIDIDYPEVYMTHHFAEKDSVTEDSIPKLPPKSFYEIISPSFERVAVSKLSLNGGVFEIAMEREVDTALIAVKDIGFYLDDFLVDSTSYKDNRFLYSNDIQFSFGNACYTFPDKTYDFCIDNLNLSLNDSTLKMEKIALKSIHPKFEFAYKNKKHSDWMDLDIENLLCKNIHFTQLLHHKTIKMDSMFLENSTFQVFKNQKIIIQHNKMPMIYEQVQDIPVPFDIHYLKSSNMRIVYDELDKNGINPGVITFTEMEGIFYDFTNIVRSHDQVNAVDAKGKLMGEGAFTAKLYFPVDPANDRCEIIGTLNSMNLRALNSILEPLSPVKVNNGFIRKMDFHIVGGSKKADIDLLLLYNDLSLGILRDNQQKSKNSFLSFIANSLIKKDNPDDGKTQPRRVQAEHIRDPYHSSFNYLWKIYFSGLVGSIGFSDQTQKNAKWVMNEINKLKGNGDDKEDGKKK